MPEVEEEVLSAVVDDRFLLLGPLFVERDVEGEDVFVVLVVVVVGCGEAGAAQESGVVVVGGTLICCDESVGEGVCQGLSECEKGWEEDGDGGEYGGRVNPSGYESTMWKTRC